MHRREFIRNCSLFCLSTIGTAAALQACKTVSYVANTAAEGKIIVKKSDFGKNKFVLVKNEKLNAPVYLLKLDEQNYSAVLMLCTHKGCELNPAGDQLVCPCHGSEFSSTGKVVSPPADADLQRFIVTSDLNNIYIHL